MAFSGRSLLASDAVRFGKLQHAVLTGYSLHSDRNDVEPTIFTELLQELLSQGWSRGSVLAFGTRVRGFASGRSRRIFRAKKNPQHALLRRGSKAVGPMS